MTGFENKKIILHLCCAVCGAYITEFLKNNFKEVILYFYNPNIYPKEEYQKRFESVKTLAKMHKLELIEGNSNYEKWLNKVEGSEEEKEGRKRCSICFDYRLREVAELTKKKGFDCFFSSLPLSPYKKDVIIKEIGDKIAKEYQIEFLDLFSMLLPVISARAGIQNSLNDVESHQEIKKYFWEKTIKKAKENDFYFQKYCGCEFSKKVK